MALLFQMTQAVAHGFQAFWDRWPRREAKKDAEKAWHQKVKTAEVEQKIHTALDWQIPMLLERDPNYRPLAATWLRGERWEDEPPTTTRSRPIAKVTPIKPQTTLAEQQMEARAKIRELVALGVTPEDAKRQVFIELGWIKP